jgi:hypothetical protein
VRRFSGDKSRIIAKDQVQFDVRGGVEAGLKGDKL